MSIATEAGATSRQRLTTLWHNYRACIWSGLFAALVLVAVGLALRWAFGIGTLLELLGDRIAPLLGLHLFFFLIGSFKSYVRLKEFGILSMLANLFAAGIVFGLFYTWLQRRNATSARKRLYAAISMAFVVVIAFLWGNLLTNYRGLPPHFAVPLSLAGLTLAAALFAWSIPASYALLTERSAPQTGPDRTRRRLLLGGGSAALTLFSAAAFVHFFRISTYSYDGTVNAGPDLPPITPNDKFYSVTKNNVDPAPSTRTWGLEVKGDVRTPLHLRRADFDTMPSQQQQATLQCISNPIGGTLSSNAVWTGVPLSHLLQQAGSSPRAVQVMLYGADGFVDAIPVDAALHPYTIVAFRMNDADIPEHHGFPVRLIVPGYVGEKSVKWLTAIQVRETPGEGFYEKQGWGPHFTIENDSRFDTPDDGDTFKVGETIQLKGTAFCGDRGVRGVQVSTDGGDTWQNTDLTYPGTHLTWAQWRFTFRPDDAEEYTLQVRSIDGMGAIQSDETHGPGPGQSSGRQELTLKVTT